MFGISFGKKKTTQDTTTDLNKVENTTQNQSSNRNQSSSTSSTGSSSQTGSTTNQAAGTSASASRQDSATRSQSLSDATIASLEARVGNLLNDTTLSSSINTSLDDLNDFDSAGFINSSVASAEGRERNAMDEFLGGVADSVGSAVGNNSMSALLATRAAGDAAARIEGVRANATQTAAEITRQQALARTQIAGANSGQLDGLLAALKGSVTTGTGTQTGSEAGSTTNSSSGTSQQNVNTSEQSNTALTEALSQLLTGTTNTNANERSIGKTTNSGGGFSLSL